MNINRDRIDDAIDHVAARMTRVEDNDALASQIISTLPERVSWFGWLFDAWAPRLAMIAIVVIAGLAWTNRRSQPATLSTLPLASVPTVSTPTALVAEVRELAPNRTTPMERRERLEPLEPERPDHERSLEAIAAPAALSLAMLAPAVLPEDAPLTLKPLAIGELPLTADTISPR